MSSPLLVQPLAVNPGDATPVANALSLSGCNWGGTATATATLLAVLWAQSLTVAAGAVYVGLGGTVLRCTTGGTTLSSGTGPSMTGASVAEGSPSAVVWAALGAFGNGMVLANLDGSNPLYWDWFGDKAGGYTLAAGQSISIPCGNPSLIYLWSGSSVAWTCAGAA